MLKVVGDVAVEDMVFLADVVGLADGFVCVTGKLYRC